MAGVWCDQCPLNLAIANMGDWVSAKDEQQKGQSHHAVGARGRPITCEHANELGPGSGASPTGCPYRIRGLSTVSRDWK